MVVEAEHSGEKQLEQGLVKSSLLLLLDSRLARMESHDYEHYRNLTLMFFFEKLLEKGGDNQMEIRWNCGEKCDNQFPKFHQ